ncbi:THO complex subunit 1 transcription elongation factor-domain-containing protein [Chytridium lagenaria]|nr:THO complex subunit 1 transcription elongation factor-domain-containing protein [Chytridium lagenaria]
MRLQSVDYERFFKEAEIFLDFAICLASETNVVEPSFPMVMIEDLMDILTLDGAIRLFDYIESRVDLLVKDIDPMKGKGLVLLRFCNELLRRLSKTKNTVFCGRILIFLTSIYPLTERSGVNLRGDFNLDNVTLYENYEDTRNVKPLISPAPGCYSIN